MDNFGFILHKLVLLFMLHAKYIHAQDPVQNAPVIINSYGNCDNSNGGSGSSDLESQVHDLERRVSDLEYALDQQQQVLQDINGGNPISCDVIRDCDDIYRRGNSMPGLYEIKPMGATRPYTVYCTRADGTTWTQIQRRSSNATSFQRSWASYQNTFGNTSTNYWLGLNKMHQITNQRDYRMRVDLTDWEGVSLHSEYRYFHVGDESEDYTLMYNFYSDAEAEGAGDALTDYHNGMPFSTHDRDNDNDPEQNCAQAHGGGWWYNSCDRANLNGHYRMVPDITDDVDNGIEWISWRDHYSFREAMMRVAPLFTDNHPCD